VSFTFRFLPIPASCGKPQILKSDINHQTSNILHPIWSLASHAEASRWRVTHHSSLPLLCRYLALTLLAYDMMKLRLGR
jgi:hypothetical protein